MSQEPASADRPRRGWIIYLLTVLLTAGVCVGVTALLMNIRQRKDEGTQRHFLLVELTEDTVDPAEWGKNFPRQYDSYRRTVDTQRTKYGGSEAVSLVAKGSRLPRIFAGYAFAVDYNEERGHAYMLSDQDASLRTKPPFKQTGACLHCHASTIPAYRKAGKEKLGKDKTDKEYVMAGFEAICAMPLGDARKLSKYAEVFSQDIA